MIERQQIQWSFERNEAGEWALCARVAGQEYLITQWYPDRETLVEKLKLLVAAPPVYVAQE